jgi:hypothetical protein
VAAFETVFMTAMKAKTSNATFELVFMMALKTKPAHLCNRNGLHVGYNDQTRLLIHEKQSSYGQ